MRSPAFRAEGKDEERHGVLAVYGERGHGSAVCGTWAEGQRVGVPLPQIAEQVGLVCLELAAQCRRGRGGVATVSDAVALGSGTSEAIVTTGSPDWKWPRSIPPVSRGRAARPCCAARLSATLLIQRVVTS